MKHTVCLFIFFTLFWSSAQKNITHYTTAEGLPHDITYGLFQDDQGYLWIGTDNGLSLFDGHQFKNFNIDNGLRTNYAIAAHQFDSSKTAVATWSGGLHMVKNNKIVIPQIENDSLEKINNLAIWNKSIVVNHYLGPLIYKKKKNGFVKKTLLFENSNLPTLKLADFPFHQMQPGRLDMTNNNLWFCNGLEKKDANRPLENIKGLYKINENFTSLKEQMFFKNKTLRGIFDFFDENIAVDKDSLYFFSQKQVTRRLALPNLPNQISKVLTRKDSSLVFLVTDDKNFNKAFSFNTQTGKLQNIASLLNTNSPVSDILEDHEENLWVSTYGDGVFCILKNTSTIYPYDEYKLPKEGVQDMLVSNDSVYVLTSGNLTVFKNLKFLNSYPLKGFGKKLTKTKKGITVASLNHNSQNDQDEFNEIEAFGLYKTRTMGDILNADSLYIQKNNQSIFLKKDKLYDVQEFNDTLWLATNSGLYYYDFLSNIRVRKVISGKKLSSIQINDFHKRQDALWLGTLNGLVHISNDNFKTFTKKDGLVDNSINTLYFDHKGVLWIGTQNGLSVFDGAKFINLTPKTGFSSLFVDKIIEDDKNRVWINGNNGITILNNEDDIQLEAAPKLHVEQDDSNFNINVISYNRTNSIVCEYRLNNEPWKNTEIVRGTFSFPPLKKGNYKITFRAKKVDSEWAFSPEFSFKVKPPWYKDSFWLTIITLIVAFVLITLILWRLQVTRKRNKVLKTTLKAKKRLEKELTDVRENIARDFHDELGNRLARISIFSDLLKQSKNNDENQTELLAQINSDADYLYKGTKDFIFSLNSESDMLEELITYLSDFGEEYFNQFDIAFLVEKEVNPNVKLPYYWSKQLIFIFKEAMTNVAKHSDCTEVKMNFYFKGIQLKISCQDNGEVNNSDTRSTGNGICNMKKRAKEIKGTLEIDSIENKGTCVKFWGNIK